MKLKLLGVLLSAFVLFIPFTAFAFKVPANVDLTGGAFNIDRAFSLTTAGQPGKPSVQTGNGPGSFAGIGDVGSPNSLKPGTGSGAAWCANNLGYQLGAKFDDVYACGPPTGLPDPFDTAGFQCVELSERFLWAVYKDYVPDVPDGRDFVRFAHSDLGTPIGLPGTHSVPAPGDIVSLWGGLLAQPYGHTAVVTSVKVDSSGNGTIGIMEQNGTANGWDQINVSDWKETYGDPNYAGGIFYYTNIQWLKIAKASSQPSLKYKVSDLGTGYLRRRPQRQIYRWRGYQTWFRQRPRNRAFHLFKRQAQRSTQPGIIRHSGGRGGDQRQRRNACLGKPWQFPAFQLHVDNGGWTGVAPSSENERL